MTTPTIAASPEEHLENGHGAATPAGDNLLLDFARGEAEAFGVIVDALGGRVEHDPEYGVHLRDSGRPTPFANAALLSRPIAEREVDGLVGRLRAFFGGTAGGPYMVFSPFPIADLSPHGFAPVGHPPLMLRAPGGAAPLVDGLQIVSAHDESTLADFEQTLIEAYPIPEMQPWQHADFLRSPALDSRWRFFVGYEGERAVATAAAYVAPTVTIVELVSARPECRGKGYGAALTAAATLAEPDRPAMLVASDLGRGVYARLGYTAILRYTLWLGMRCARRVAASRQQRFDNNVSTTTEKGAPMYLGTYRFAGDPDDLLTRYDRMMAGFPQDSLLVHLCVRGDDGITVIDTCPNEAEFRSFSTSAEFRAALGAVGLPEPVVDRIGDVHMARTPAGPVPSA